MTRYLSFLSFFLVLVLNTSCLKDPEVFELEYNPFDSAYSQSITAEAQATLEPTQIPEHINDRYRFTIEFQITQEVYDYLQRVGLDSRPDGHFILRLYRNGSSTALEGQYDFGTNSYTNISWKIPYDEVQPGITYTHTESFFSDPYQMCARFALQHANAESPDRRVCWDF